MSMFEFRAGDIVGHAFYDGEFELRDSKVAAYPFLANITSVGSDSFTLHGLVDVSHGKPSIYLIRRPKKIVWKTIEVIKYGVVNLRTGNTSVFHRVESALESQVVGKEIVISLVGNYQIEVGEN